MTAAGTGMVVRSESGDPIESDRCGRRDWAVPGGVEAGINIPRHDNCACVIMKALEVLMN